MDFSLRPTEAGGKRQLQALYSEAYHNPDVVYVSKDEAGAAGQGPTLYGATSTQPDTLNGVGIRRNLTLVDRDSGVILQRFVPLSFDKHREMLQQIAIGRLRFDALREHRTDQEGEATGSSPDGVCISVRSVHVRGGSKDKTPANNKGTVSFSAAEHLDEAEATERTGDHHQPQFWFGQGDRFARTGHTTQATAADTERVAEDKEAMIRALRFMAWLRRYVEKYVELMIIFALNEAELHPPKRPRKTTYEEDEETVEPLLKLAPCPDTAHLPKDAPATEKRNERKGGKPKRRDDSKDAKPAAARGGDKAEKKTKRDKPPRVKRQFAMDLFFRTRLLGRLKDFKQLKTKVPIARDLSHKLYNVCSAVQGFGTPHREKGDSAPTTLLNFGYARLHLPQYNVVVDLHPCEVVFFDAEVEQVTTRHPSQPGLENDRWGVTCVFERGLHKPGLAETYARKVDVRKLFDRIMKEDRDPARLKSEMAEAEQHVTKLGSKDQDLVA